MKKKPWITFSRNKQPLTINWEKFNFYFENRSCQIMWDWSTTNMTKMQKCCLTGRQYNPDVNQKSFHVVSVTPHNSWCVCVDVAGLQRLTSLLAWLLNTDSSTVSASDNNRRNLFWGRGLKWESTRSLLVVGCFTLSLILSALSGSPPPPPRFLNSVMFRSFPKRDVNVSHKPTPKQGGRKNGNKIPADTFQSR